jgi:lathosterol oxidase
VIFLFVVPVHYFTHVFLLFFSGVWATNIHDAMWGDTEPIMGSKYHTVHHTHYHYNFGQFFTFCDSFWGTLKVPEKSKFD